MGEEVLFHYSLIIGTILGFIFGILVSVNFWSSKYGTLLNSFHSLLRLIGMTLVGGFLTLILTFFVISIYSVFVDYEEKEKHYIYPVSLSRENNVEGSFILGSGSINEVSYYYFYYESIYGFKLSKIESNNVYIVETKKRRPEIVEVVKYYDQTSKIKLQPSVNPIRVIIYVPENTIIRQFKIN